ncbi:protein of unknown function [Candidatus Nitrospira inopinata]|uniref:Uncharacterized protein n=1 Tax=Candidatus Nitrospira inopinata TaxID=1715989 RepID=A0A0S4KWZ8_9BACT|nr:protein of unknown function [Candidatus Nitrospira inopinata]
MTDSLLILYSPIDIPHSTCVSTPHPGKQWITRRSRTSLAWDGAPGWNRTSDPQLRRPT